MSWNVVRLSDHCDLITKGTTPTTLGFDFSDRGIPFLRAQNIQDGSVRFSEDALFIDEQTHNALDRSQIQPGDVLVSIAGTIGRAGIVPDDAPQMNCNQAVAIVRTREAIYRPFLRYWLESTGAQSQIRNSAVTGVISNLSLSQLSNLRLPLPPLPEQRRIAEILDKADALRAKRRAALAQLSTLTQSIFLDMFGDPATNPKGWPVFPLGSKCIIAGEYGANVASTDFDPDMPRYVRITDVTEEGELNDQPVSPAGSRNDWEPYALAPGDLLFARSGATVGKTYMHTESNGRCVFAGYTIRFRPDRRELLPEYLFAFTRSAAYRAWVAARQRVVAQPNINAKQYGHELLIPLPPIGLQGAFATRMVDVDRARMWMRTSHDELHVLFASLQHRAFRGEL